MAEHFTSLGITKNKTMSLMIKFFCFLLVIGFAGLFILKKPDGTPWLSLDDFVPDTSSIKQTLDDAIPNQIIGGSNENVTVYKWKDNEGNWQFSDTPPQGLNAEQVLVSTDVNRDLAPPPPTNPTITKEKKGKAFLIKDSGTSPTTLSPDKISTLIDDAKNVQNLVDEHKRQLDSGLPSNGQ